MVSRPLPLLIATALIAVASPALAQTWPAGVVIASGVRALGPEARAYARNDQTTPFARRAPITPTEPVPAPFLTAVRDEAALKVDIRAKAEWSDDQGLRASPARVSYKRRF